MSNTTVAQFAAELNRPVDDLLKQLKEAGVNKNSGNDSITTDDKQLLTAYLQKKNGSNSGTISIRRKKTEVMRERLLDINPELALTVCDRFIHPSDAGEWLAAYTPDMLADCIDSIACKAALIAAAQARGIAVISAMGAGNRLDVSRARIRSLNQTSGCPLARELRRTLKAHGANLGYPVVYSDEPRRQPLPHQPVGGDVPGRARAVNGTISYLPALFGIMMAGHIIQTLLGETASAS
mgnify:CR=1 FL=1